MLGSRLSTRQALVLLALLCVPARSWQSGRIAPVAAVLPGKGTFNYNVEWRLIDAGKAKLSWSTGSPSSHPGWQVKLHLESTGLVAKLYKVNDDYSADLSNELCA